MRATSLVFGTTALILLAGDAGGGEAKKSKLEGTWRAVTVVKGGKEEKDDKNHVLTFAGKTFTLKEGDKVMAAGTFKTDDAKKPHEIDMEITEADKADFKGKTVKGIYEIKEDTLRWCLSEPGSERPTELAGPAGTRIVLVTLMREKK
jgi:uncharacterized protein (TIGR03067 family)